MEDIHGVSVSWVHHPSKPGSKSPRPRATSASSVPRDGHHSSANNGGPPAPRAGQTQSSKSGNTFPGAVTPPALSQPAKSDTTALPSTPPQSKSQSRRPGLLSRSSSERINGGGPRRTSWMSNISNKFSSSPSDKAAIASAQPPSNQASANSPYGTSSGAPSASKTSITGITEEAEPQTPPKQKESSFFSSLTRKWSAGSQASGGLGKVQGKGGMCERRVLNVDPNRERCPIVGADTSRLRKVSFCVDVEIAGGPRYVDDEGEDDAERKKKFMDAKAKERAEGEALRRPEAITEEEEDIGQTKMENKRKGMLFPEGVDVSNLKIDDQDSSAAADGQRGTNDEQSSVDKKKEKKKRSEEERKERKEKRRRRAEENGSIPVELSMDADPADVTGSSPPGANLADGQKLGLANNGTRATPEPRSSRPTTDPVRIYRRCCQLRETPILKRITEQLMSPTCCVPTEPGVVHCLDLTGSRLQLADMVTLGDWLAVVPVKKLLLEDANVPDEGLRCILAGLLAAKRPEPTRRRGIRPRHREEIPFKPHRERSGVIEKLVLKNNPRISRHGWKHIGLFLYMCRSIKAIDLSMIKFPSALPADQQESAKGHSANKPDTHDLDAAEVFYKCLSERLGGDKLDEFIVSECSFTTDQIRRIVDSVIVCGVNKLGLAGNNIDDEGLEHVLRYLRSGICGGLDLGGNNLQGKLDHIAEALASSSSKRCWGLSLAGCNLDTASLRPLFPVLTTLPDFRFIDLSHNRNLCSKDGDAISLLRRYMGKMKALKRIHLADVGMNAKQAIALADVLPEGPSLAHVSILSNPKLTALANAKDENNQEEACALYASYMAAVRVSNTLICIDIDVPSNDNSEVVKALAKQVVAYSLRNMEQFAIVEATGAPADYANAAAALTQAHGGEKKVKEVAVPDVLMHLVGHIDGLPENHDEDDPAPDDDYIVGGTGVVKALQYVLGEKASDSRRISVTGTATPLSGALSPRPGSSAGLDQETRGKAKKMSKNLLESARKIRARLRPALLKDLAAGDDASYRRLLFLDQTLQSMISRFEEEYPETRIGPSSPPQPVAGQEQRMTEQPTPLSLDASSGNDLANRSDEDEDLEHDARPYSSGLRRNGSDASLASRRSRALAIEEGQLHRLGQSLRREVIDSPTRAFDDDESVPPEAQEAARLKELQVKLENISGTQLKSMVQQDGWTETLAKVGANIEDLRTLQQQDPWAWEAFKESHLKARLNMKQEAQHS